MPRYDCSGKTAYPTFKRAEDVARYQRKKMGEPLHAYACKICGKYHCGQPPFWEKEKRKPVKKLKYAAKFSDERSD